MHGDDEEALAPQLAEIGSRPAAERASFLMELGERREGRANPALAAFLADPDPMVRVAAAQAVWLVEGGAAETARLVEVLAAELRSENDDVALMAGTALVNLGEAALIHLIRWFDERGGGDPLAVRVVGEIAGPRAVEFLRRVVGSPHEDVAEEAREALAAIAREEG